MRGVDRPISACQVAVSVQRLAQILGPGTRPDTSRPAGQSRRASIPTFRSEVLDLLYDLRPAENWSHRGSPCMT